MNGRAKLLFWGSLWMLLVLQFGCGGSKDATGEPELQRVKSGDMDVVLLSSHPLKQGKDQFTIEFRSNPGNQLVDVGNVRMTASMPMPGMPMFGSIEIQKTNIPGRYAATSDITMAGSWRLAIEWDGPKGSGSVNFSGTVQ